MKPTTQISVAEIENLSNNPGYVALRTRLEAQFDLTLQALLSNADAPEANLRANIGVLSGLRTALDLPSVILREAAVEAQLQEQANNKEETDVKPE